VLFSSIQARECPGALISVRCVVIGRGGAAGPCLRALGTGAVTSVQVWSASIHGSCGSIGGQLGADCAVCDMVAPQHSLLALMLYWVLLALMLYWAWLTAACAAAAAGRLGMVVCCRVAGTSGPWWQ
jgi:hypothetical protein